MVVMVIGSLKLEKEEQHLATQFQVSDTMNFSNIVLEKELSNRGITDDAKKQDLTMCVFTENLEPGKTYFGRTRVLLSTGWTAYNNLDVMVMEDKVDLNENESMPTRVGIPILNTFIQGKAANPFYHDATGFVVTATMFSVIGNATHTATSWMIEDLYGNVVWASLVDTINKESIRVDNIILESGKVYRIKAMFHTSSHDSSQIGTRTIMVNGGSEITLVSDIDILYPSREIRFDVNTVEEATLYTWEILTAMQDRSVVVFRKSTAEPYVTLRAYALEPNKNYILRVKSDVNNTFKYYNLLMQDYFTADPAPAPNIKPLTIDWDEYPELAAKNYEAGPLWDIYVPDVDEPLKEEGIDGEVIQVEDDSNVVQATEAEGGEVVISGGENEQHINLDPEEELTAEELILNMLAEGLITEERAKEMMAALHKDTGELTPEEEAALAEQEAKKQEALDKTEEAISTLKEQLNTLDEELNQKQNDLTIKEEELRRKSNEATAKEWMLNQELEKLNQSMATERSNLTEKEAQLADNARDTNQARDRIIQLQNDIARYQEEIATITRQITAKEQEIQNKEDEIGDARNNLDSKKLEAEALKEEMDKKVASYNTLKEQHANTIAGGAELETQKTEKEAEIRTKEQEISTLEAETNNLNSSIVPKAAEVKKQDDILKNKGVELASKNNRLKEIEAILENPDDPANADQDMDALRQEKEEITTAVAELQEVINTATEAKNREQAALDELEAQSEPKQQALEAAQRALATLNQEKTEIEGQIANLGDEYRIAMEAVKQAEVDKAAAEKDYNTSAQQRDYYQELVNTGDQLIESLNNELNTLKANKTKAENNKQKAEQELNTTNETIADLANSKTEIEEEITRLEETIASGETDAIRQLREELAQVNAEKERLTAERDALKGEVTTAEGTKNETTEAIAAKESEKQQIINGEVNVDDIEPGVDVAEQGEKEPEVPIVNPDTKTNKPVAILEAYAARGIITQEELTRAIVTILPAVAADPTSHYYDPENNAAAIARNTLEIERLKKDVNVVKNKVDNLEHSAENNVVAEEGQEVIQS